MSRQDDPSAPVVATDHHHGTMTLQEYWDKAGEAGVAVRLMDDHGVHCGDLGAHRHGHVQTLHHHHDLTCLIEAGANMVRPELDATVQHLRNLESLVEQVSRRNVEQAQELWDAKQNLEHVKASRETVKKSRERLRESLEHLEVFVSRTPAQGPWLTVMDAYQSWQQEEREQVDRAKSQAVYDLLAKSISDQSVSDLKDEKQ